MSKDTNPESTPQEEPSIGEFLRTEREKNGISKSNLAENIKVREHVIDALENEEWDKLPARVFIKGFIRSYTISIGSDTKKALRLFDKSVPLRSEGSPVPLTGRRKKNRAMYYAVPILILLTAAIYLFSVQDRTGNDIESDQSVSETSLPPTETGQEQSLPEQVKPAVTSIPEEVKETTPPPEPEKEVVAQEESSLISEEKAEKEEKTEEISEETTPAEEIIQDENVMEEEAPPETESVAAEPQTPMMTLSAMVNMRTYVRIIVDDNPPKEFIFQPGKTAQWAAERGFEVKVGNAAGIEFEFNGKKIKNIGDMGKVKTLRFPEDFKTNWEEE